MMEKGKISFNMTIIKSENDHNELNRNKNLKM